MIKINIVYWGNMITMYFERQHLQFGVSQSHEQIKKTWLGDGKQRFSQDYRPVAVERHIQCGGVEHDIASTSQNLCVPEQRYS